jgi:hypothetical protein
MMALGFDEDAMRRTLEGVKPPLVPASPSGKQVEYAGKLDRCEDFRDVFVLVKASVKDALGMERTGLMLYLRDLPMKVGAYHQLGTNGIIMNRVLLEQVVQSTSSRLEVNAFIYFILLHEYLHTLGLIDETRVRHLTYQVTEETFGSAHVATKIAAEGPWSLITLTPFHTPRPYERGVEIVRDFEDPSSKYIA